MVKRRIFCEPPSRFPITSENQAKNAIARAVQFRTGAKKEAIIRCACRVLKKKYGKVTPACEGRGF